MWAVCRRGGMNDGVGSEWRDRGVFSAEKGHNQRGGSSLKK